jgi:hypothetical protein
MMLELLDLIDEAEKVIVTFNGEESIAMVSAWNGSATVNTATFRVDTPFAADIKLDVWTNYGLQKLGSEQVAEMMREDAEELLKAIEAEEEENDVYAEAI